MYHIPIDLQQIVFELLDIKTQINMLTTCVFIREYIHIKSLKIKNRHIRDKLNDKILSNKIFSEIIELRLTISINDLTNTTKIKKLFGTRYLKQNSIELQQIKQIINVTNIIENNFTFSPDIKLLSIADYCSLAKCNSEDLIIEGMDGDACIEDNNIYVMANLKNITSRNLYVCGKNEIQVKNNKSVDLTELYIPHNTYITDISFMTNLKILNANSSVIRQMGIRGLNLIKLNISYNDYITDVSFMTNLKKLIARGSSALTSKGIKKLQLRHIDLSDNKKIKKIPSMKSLKHINISGFCCIDQNNIEKFNPIILNISSNRHITSIKHMINLKVLHCNYNCKMSIISINSLVELNLNSNPHIEEIPAITTLKILRINGSRCALNQKSIDKLNVVKLSAKYNNKITDVSHMSNLLILNAYSNNISQKGISGLKLIKLNISSNIHIISVSHLTNLQVLYATGNSCALDRTTIQDLHIKNLRMKGIHTHIYDPDISESVSESESDDIY